jgi:hypothetical protein
VARREAETALGGGSLLHNRLMLAAQSEPAQSIRL